MSINQEIIAALAGLGPDIVPDVYTGDENEYIVFNYSSLPDDFGDDMPGEERYLIQIHLFSPPKKNRLALRRQIKQRLFAADFGWPSETNASDEDSQHFIYECECAKAAGEE